MNSPIGKLYAPDMQDFFKQGFDELAPKQQKVLLSELKRIAKYYLRGERDDHTLQTTELVNEAYVNLAGKTVFVESKAHFMALAARQMRRILVDHARKKLSAKRHAEPIMCTVSGLADPESTFTVDLIHIDKLLKDLSEFDRRSSQTMELKLFSSLNNDEISQLIGVSLATTERDLKAAKAWLKTEMTA